MRDTARPRALDLIALGALAGSVLAFEVILLRLFEFSHWHHFAGLSIALALLGLGSAGTVLTLLGERAVAAGDRWFAGGMLIAAAGFLFVLWLNSQIALRPVFAVWDMGELARILAVDLAAFLPFFGAGLAIGQVFPRWPAHPARLYSANLFGSGFGSVAASGLLVWFSPEAALAMVAVVLVAAAGMLAVVRRMIPATVAALALLLTAGWMVHDPPDPQVSDFKALARLTDLPDSEVVSVEPGLSGRLSVVRAPSLRFAPGLSLNFTGEVPVRDAAVIGSDRVVPLARQAGESPSFGRASLAGLPLDLREHGRVLAVGSSVWSTPLVAAGRELLWLEPDRRLTDRARSRGMDFRAVTDGAFRFLATSEQTFALISFDGAFGGGDAASEDALLTRQGLSLALDRLEPGGLLSLPVEISYPPRHGPRLLATVYDALQARGIEQPGAHVAALRSMQAMVVLVAAEPLAMADIDQIGRFAERWGFDRVWLPGMAAEQANQNHVLDEPVFHEAAAALFAGRQMPKTARWFETDAASLDRPYFWRAMRWSTLPTLFDRLGQRAASLLDWTLVMSVVSMAVVTVLGMVLILAPLGRMPALRPPLRRLSVAGYFLALGLGFMLIEMAVFQRTVLYLDRPVLAASVVFAVFLIGAGVGSAMPPKAPAVPRIFGALAIGGLATIGVLWLAMDGLLALPIGWRVAVLVAAMAPLTWAMGRPLPWALGQLSDQPRWMPWGWGINAFASVAAASLAPLTSVHFGQPATVAASMVCYLGAWRIASHWTGTSTGE